MIQLGDFKTTTRQKKIINSILESGQITEGKYVKLFEREVEKFIGVKHAIAVSNGTVALQLVAQYLKHKYGNKLTICIPATTFPATLNAFLNYGFKTVLCDIRPNTLCIDIDKLTEKQKEKIDVIVPVHLMGYTANMIKIKKAAKKYGWIIVEDFAEAFGSIYRGKRVGSIGNFGCSSFYVSHILQGGELGVVTTNNSCVAKIMRSMKNHGRTGEQTEFKHDYMGSNYKTTEFCAGICYPQIKEADKFIKRRQKNAKHIKTHISNVLLKPFPVGENYSFLGYPILAETTGYRRYICKILNKHGIETRNMFPCLANQKAFKDMYNKRYKVSENIERVVFYIGCHQYLSKDDLKKMIFYLNGGKK